MSTWCRLRRGELILALDVDTLTEAKYFVNALYPAVKIFKIGPVLFTAYGPKVVEMALRKNAKIFLDLKYHDIPNTVAKSVAQAVRLGVFMLTVHASGGKEMLEAAVKAARDEAKKLGVKKPLIIGVTVLTSRQSGPREIVGLAKQAIACGLDGVVSSAQEAGILKREIKEKFVIVTPGIRPQGPLMDDQKRTATVSEAISAGSDFLVVGRPILKAKDPLGAADAYLKEIKRARTY